MAVLYTHYLTEPYWALGIYWGGLGVRLFFVLSGFLITGILLRERVHAGPRPSGTWYLIRQFYVRRLLRLTPIFYLTLALMFLLDVPNTRETVWWHVFYLSNIKFALTNDWQGYTAHFWSLAVEEQFYLFWPLAVLFLRIRTVVIVSLAVLPAVVLYGYVGFRLGVADIPLWVLPPASADALVIGALLAVGTHHAKLASTQRWLQLAGTAGLVTWGAASFAGDPGSVLSCSGPTGIALFFGWVVLRASEGRATFPDRLLQTGWLTHVGRISYGMYVIHNLVGYSVGLRFSQWLPAYADDVLLVAAVSGTLTFLFAAISWRFVEAPINRYRHSFQYRKTSPGSCSDPDDGKDRVDTIAGIQPVKTSSPNLGSASRRSSS